MEKKNLLELVDIEKEFSGNYALKKVSMSVERGEIHALLGENGAGKSTLIKIITGIYTKSAGKMYFDGNVFSPEDNLEAQKIGISTVYQEQNLSPFLSVAENIFLGHELKNKYGLIDWKKTYEESKKILRNLGINDINVKIPLNMCSTAIQQMIAIARALTIDAKLLIMDEPTSSLDADEVEILFNAIREMRQKGISIIYVSHRMEEIFEICDRATVLKDGEYVGTYQVAELNYDKLLSLMLGRDATGLLIGKTSYENEYLESNPVVCEMRDISKGKVLSNVNLKIHEGEVVGLAGLLGSGRTEIAKIVAGVDQLYVGDLYINGKLTKFKSPREAINNGIAFCPEDRKAEGIFSLMSVLDNMTMVKLPKITKYTVVNTKMQEDIYDDYYNKMSIKAASNKMQIKYLSGGNQQKVILSREVCTNPKLIILDEPTRGIDVGAKSEIEKIITELAEQGIAVLFISSELEELVRRCDRVAVLYNGHIIRELIGNEISKDAILDTIASRGIDRVAQSSEVLEGGDLR